jgi:hypothetical protein
MAVTPFLAFWDLVFVFGILVGSRRCFIGVFTGSRLLVQIL